MDFEDHTSITMAAFHPVLPGLQGYEFMAFSCSSFF